MTGFIDRLKAVLTSKDIVDSGQLQWVSLDMVRCKAGDDWIRIAKTVYDVSARFIESKLSPEDEVIRARGGFIIIFATPDPDAAKAKVGEVSSALNGFFRDDHVLSMLGVSATAETISPKRLLDRIASNAARERAPGADRFGVSEAGPDFRPLEYAAVDPETMRALGDGAPRRASGTRRAAGSEAETDADAPENASRFDPGADGDSIVFKPSWDAHEERISTYFCLARRNRRGQALYGRQVLMGADAPDLNRALDISVADAAAEAAARQSDSQVRVGIVAPTAFAAIAAPGFRSQFLDTLSAAPQQARARLYIQIDDIPLRTPTTQLEEIIGDIHEFGARALAKTPWGESDLHQFDGLGVDLFGVSATLKACRDGVSPTEAEALESWSDWARRLNAGTYVTQAESVELIEGAVRAGVRYFAGDAIGGDCAAPKPAAAKPLAALRRGAMA